MQKKKVFLAGAIAVSSALLFTSCAGQTGSSSEAAGDKLNVVATTTQLGDFVKEIGGKHVELTTLLKAGASAHHFDPSPADLAKLGSADVLVVNGAGLETFVDSLVKSSGFKGKLVTAADGIDLAKATEITVESGYVHEHDHEEEGEAHEHGTEEHADEHSEEEHTHEHGDEHDHEHSDTLNPHIWTSLHFAEGMVDEVANGLAGADPQNKKDYKAAAAAYNKKLAALDEWIAAAMEKVPAADRQIVSGHDSMGYYLHDYNIKFAGSIMPSFEDNAEPSAADISALVQTIKDNGVKAIFVESSMSPKLAETIAKEAGVKVVGDDTLYADSLGANAGTGKGVDEGIKTDTYLGATIHNTRVLLDAWGASIPALPDALHS